MLYIVSEIYYPEEAATSHIVTKIAEGLASEIDVHVLTGPPDYTSRYKASALEKRNGVTIERISALSLDKNKVINRILRAAMLTLTLGYRAFRRIQRNDLVLILTNPAPLPLLMTIICKIRRAKMLLLVHDVFPDNLVPAQLLHRGSFIFRMLLSLFRKVYLQAAHIIVIGRDMRDLILRMTGRSPDDITVIPNWADTEEIFPCLRSKSKIIRELRIEDKFIVQCAGNIGRVQGLEQIVNAAEILRDEKYHFLFIGDGARRGWLEREVAGRGLLNITIIGYQQRSRQVDFLNACDISLVSLAPEMLGLGVPSRTYNILAAGKPVLAVVEPSSEIARMVQEEAVGWVVAPGSPQRLATAIREAGSSNLDVMRTNARIIAETKYSFESALKRYKDVISRFR